MLALFKKVKDDRHRRRRLEAAIHAALGLGPYDFVRANEVACEADGCPDVVTTVLVMRAGCRIEMLRAEKPLEAAEPRDFLVPAALHPATPLPSSADATVAEAS